MRIGIDLDDVTAQFSEPANDLIFRKANQSYRRCDRLKVDRWRWWEDYPNGERHWQAFWRYDVRANGFFRKVQPVPGAINALRLLDEMGVDIAYVTHRPADAFGDTVAWLTAHDVVHPVYMVEDKSSVECDLYVDDKPENVRHLLAEGRKAFLFDQPWNQDTLDAVRVKSWLDFMKVVASA